LRRASSTSPEEGKKKKTIIAFHSPRGIWKRDRGRHQPGTGRERDGGKASFVLVHRGEKKPRRGRHGL